MFRDADSAIRWACGVETHSVLSQSNFITSMVAGAGGSDPSGLSGYERRALAGDIIAAAGAIPDPWGSALLGRCTDGNEHPQRKSEALRRLMRDVMLSQLTNEDVTREVLKRWAYLPALSVSELIELTEMPQSTVYAQRSRILHEADVVFRYGLERLDAHLKDMELFS